MIVLQSISSLKRYKLSADDTTGAVVTTETGDALSPTIILRGTLDDYQLQVDEDGSLITTVVHTTTPTHDSELMIFSLSGRQFLLSIDDSGLYIALVTTVQVPVIVAQNIVPKAYVSDYVSISLGGLLVTTYKMYPDQFTIEVSSASHDYSIISTATDGSSVKLQLLGDSTVARTITASIRVFDGSDWSATFLYQISVLQGKVKKSKPVGYGVSSRR
jgi:hypothetical protein